MQYDMPPVMGRRCQVYLSNGEVVQSQDSMWGAHFCEGELFMVVTCMG